MTGVQFTYRKNGLKATAADHRGGRTESSWRTLKSACKNDDNHRDTIELEQLGKQWHREGRRGSGTGAEQAAKWNQSRRCIEGGENAMQVEGPLVGHEHAMYAYEEHEDKAEMERQRDQIKQDIGHVDKMLYL